MAAVSTRLYDTPEPTVAELIAARPHLSMHAMDGLVMDGVPLIAIAESEGTPVWVYSAAAMRRRYRTKMLSALATLASQRMAARHALPAVSFGLVVMPALARTVTDGG